MHFNEVDLLLWALILYFNGSKSGFNAVLFLCICCCICTPAYLYNSIPKLIVCSNTVMQSNSCNNAFLFNTLYFGVSVPSTLFITFDSHVGRKDVSL